MTPGRAVPRRTALRGAARLLGAAALGALLAACGGGTPPAAPRRPPTRTSVEITQVLVGYRVEGKTRFTRSRAEALARAEKALARALAGETLEALALELTDDRDEKGQPFNRGSYTFARNDPRVVRALRDAILDTRPGGIHPRPVDTGLAFVVFRRDR